MTYFGIKLYPGSIKAPYPVNRQWVQEYSHIQGSNDRNLTVGCPVGCAQAMGTGISPYPGFSTAHTLCTNDGYRNIPISWVQYGPYTVHKQWVQEYLHIPGSLRPIHCAQAMGTGIFPYPGFTTAHTLCTNDGYRNIAILSKGSSRPKHDGGCPSFIII